MSDRAARQSIAARHVAFSLAVRGRDTLAAARAASRLRVPGASLNTREFLAARGARLALGRALVRARMIAPAAGDDARHATASGANAVTPRPLRRRRIPIWRAVAAATVVALGLLLFRPGGGFFGGGVTEQSKPAGVAVPADATLRGRSLGQASQVVVASARPTTTPSVIVPGTSATPVPIGGQGGGSPVPGGGGGLGSPAPAGTPPLPGLDFGRITVIVTDGATERPLSGVCIIIGAPSCDSAPRTDAQGRWSADIKLPAHDVLFDLHFSRDGYTTQYKQTTLIQGQEVVIHIALIR